MGWVYFLKADNGLTKIGCTKSLNQRIKSLGILLPYKLELLVAVETENHQRLEKKVHEDLCSEWHVRGEWYRLDDNFYDYLVSDITYYSRNNRHFISEGLLVPA